MLVQCWASVCDDGPTLNLNMSSDTRAGVLVKWLKLPGTVKPCSQRWPKTPLISFSRCPLDASDNYIYSHCAHDVVATLIQRHWRWFNVAQRRVQNGLCMFFKVSVIFFLSPCNSNTLPPVCANWYTVSCFMLPRGRLLWCCFHPALSHLCVRGNISYFVSCWTC